MRITFLAQELTVGSGAIAGGAQRSLHTVASHLVEQGYDITVLTVNSRRNTIEGTVSYEVIEARERLPKPVERLDRSLPSLLSAHDNTDLFHVFGPRFVPGAARYRKSADVPVVARLNSYGVFCFNMALMDGDCHANCDVSKRVAHYDGSLPSSLTRAPLMAYADIRLRRFNHLDHFFAQSPAVKRIYRDVGVTDPPMTVVPNTFHVDFDGASTADDPLSGDGFDILFASRLVAEKGVGELLTAARGVPESVTVHVVGDGPLSGAVQEAAANLETLVSHGYVEHDALPPYYASADLYVHPGTWPDPCPRSVLEALATGTPLLVTDIGGPPWMAGDACETVPPGDATALAEAIEQLAESPATREQLEAATEAELRRFSADQVIPGYTDVYDSLG